MPKGSESAFPSRSGMPSFRDVCLLFATKRMHGLPLDVQELVFEACDPVTLSSFASTSRLSNAVIASHGWPAWNRAHSNHFDPITAPLPTSPRLQAAKRAYFSHRIDRAWDQRRLSFQRIGLNTHGKTIPVLLLHKAARRLYVAFGTQLRVVLFDERGRPVNCKPLRIGDSAVEDVTGLAAVDSHPDDLLVSRLSGTIVRYTLTVKRTHRPRQAPVKPSPYDFEVVARPVAHFQHPRRSRIQALSSSGDAFASAGHRRRNDTVAVFSSRSPWLPPTTVPLPGRPWAIHLSSSTTSPFLAVGHDGPSSPASIFLFSESSILTDPIPLSDPSSPWTTSGYALARSRTCPHLLALGQFDGFVRLFDLRLVGRGGGGGETARFREPFCDSPVYSVDIGGGHGSLLAAGSARHSSVSFSQPHIFKVAHERGAGEDV